MDSEQCTVKGFVTLSLSKGLNAVILAERAPSPLAGEGWGEGDKAQTL